MFQLQAQGQHEGEDQFHKGLAVAKQVKVGGFILEIDGDGPVVAGLAGGGSHGSSSGQMVDTADDPRWTNAFIISRGWGRRRALPRNSVECGICRWSQLIHKERLAPLENAPFSRPWA
jgi:hypothetical protein